MPEASQSASVSKVTIERNLPILFGPMFHAFPMFDKFRAPMMALVLMQLSFPIIAALMLEEVYRVWKNRDRAEGLKLEKYFKYAMIAAGNKVRDCVPFGEPTCCVLLAARKSTRPSNSRSRQK